jgi:hypothetical protein
VRATCVPAPSPQSSDDQAAAPVAARLVGGAVEAAEAAEAAATAHALHARAAAAAARSLASRRAGCVMGRPEVPGRRSEENISMAEC